MAVHQVKAYPEHFAELLDGRRSYYAGKNEQFRLHDVLHVQEYQPPSAGALKPHYTGRVIRAAVISICDDPRLGLIDGYVILGLSVFNYIDGSSERGFAD